MLVKNLLHHAVLNGFTARFTMASDMLHDLASQDADTQTRHLTIGSGVVEAACKTLVTQRLKRSGMRWRHAGGQAILTLRALVQSSRFDQAWALLSDTYRQEVIVPNNVVAFPRMRAA